MVRFCEYILNRIYIVTHQYMYVHAIITIMQTLYLCIYLFPFRYILCSYLPSATFLIKFCTEEMEIHKYQL